MPNRHRSGFTLIELMIALAIIGVLTAIAIPSYQGYVTQAREGVARQNANTLRLFIEDFNLNNGTYIASSANAGASCIVTGSTYTQSSVSFQIQNCYGWGPDGDNDQFSYQVSASTLSWDILVEHSSGDWIRCEDRMSNCCNSGTTDASKSDCP